MEITNEDILVARLKDQFYITIDTLDITIKELCKGGYLSVDKINHGISKGFLVNNNFSLLNGYGGTGVQKFNKGSEHLFWRSDIFNLVNFWCDLSGHENKFSSYAEFRVQKNR